jgi:hypothetical protein
MNGIFVLGFAATHCTTIWHVSENIKVSSDATKLETTHLEYRINGTTL